MVGRQPVAARSMHGLTHGRTIQSGFSLPVRNALASRPLGAPHLPRAPVVPRTMHQVGLNSARNFSTARPVFAHLAENVPVAGRALVEADWNAQVKKERSRLAAKSSSKKERKNKKVSVEKIAFHPATAKAPVEPIVETRAEFERYFSVQGPALVPGVTTTLLIPLAPTPSSRMPLPATASESQQPPVIPFAEMSSLRYDFAHHNDRVAALYARLDAADVWDAGARCDVYGSARGEANVLRVAFEGWDAARVRSVIGETGSGWCVLEEEYETKGIELDESETESPLYSPPTTSGMATPATFADFGVDIDPAQSFMLPTLDFSSAFEQSTLASLSDSELEFDHEYLSDEESLLSDGSAGSWVGLEPPAPSRLPSESRIAFSSRFGGWAEEGPTEHMF